MHKKFFLLSLLLVFARFLSAQDIKYFFKILPASYTPDLNAAAKDSLLQGKDFYPASNTNTEAVAYTLVNLDTIKNNLGIEMSFTTGQAAESLFELRSFKTKNGAVVVFSNLGSAHNQYRQNTFIVFSYGKGDSLTVIKAPELPSNVGIRDFVKPGTPDSMIKKYESYSSVIYDLGRYMDNISLNVSDDFDMYNVDKRWLIGSSIEFIWTGDHFIRSKPIFRKF